MVHVAPPLAAPSGPRTRSCAAPAAAGRRASRLFGKRRRERGAWQWRGESAKSAEGSKTGGSDVADGSLQVSRQRVCFTAGARSASRFAPGHRAAQDRVTGTTKRTASDSMRAGRHFRVLRAATRVSPFNAKSKPIRMNRPSNSVARAGNRPGSFCVRHHRNTLSILYCGAESADLARPSQRRLGCVCTLMQRGGRANRRHPLHGVSSSMFIRRPFRRNSARREAFR